MPYLLILLVVFDLHGDAELVVPAVPGVLQLSDDVGGAVGRSAAAGLQQQTAGQARDEVRRDTQLLSHHVT